MLQITIQWRSIDSEMTAQWLSKACQETVSAPDCSNLLQQTFWPPNVSISNTMAWKVMDPTSGEIPSLFQIGQITY